MNSSLQDLRHSFRRLLTEPAFTAMAVLTLGLGIGATTVLFSVVHGVLLRPLPYRDADRIVMIWQTNPREGVEQDRVAAGNFLDWQEQSRVFERMAAAEPYSFDLDVDGQPQNIKCWLVSAGFLDILGARPERGRLFLPQEELPGSEGVVVVGHEAWRHRFGAAPGFVGRKLLPEGQPHTVVGILPAAIQFPPDRADREVWVSRTFSERYRRERTRTNLTVIARLKPGVTVEQAQREMSALAARLEQEHPDTNQGIGARVVPLSDQILGGVRPVLALLLGAAGLLLLVACLDVGHLLLARGLHRQTELASRAAFGATRARLGWQILTESLLLSLLGGACGVLLAGLGVRVLRVVEPGYLPRIREIAMDGRVLAFAVVLSFLTVLAAGLPPLLRLSRPDLRSLLSGAAATRPGGGLRLRRLLIVSEIAAALVLLIGTGLIVRSFLRLSAVDPGFRPDGVAILDLHVWSRFRKPEQRAAFFASSLERIAALPQVEAAGAVSALPFHENRVDVETSFTIEGRPLPSGSAGLTAYEVTATPGFFRALRIPLREGRPFTAADREDSPPVALVNETLARRYWPGESPVGRRITDVSSGDPVTREVVGVVGDVRPAGLESEPRPEIFLPHAQNPFGSMTLVVRTPSDPALVLPAIQKAVREVESSQAFSTTATLDHIVARTFAVRRFSLLLLGLFALLALILSAVGVYGTMTFATAQRKREIGIRMALGARTGDILRMVLREGTLLALAGVALGVTFAALLTRYLGSLLYGVSATDPLTFGAVSLFLVLVAVLASYLPARRATREDPLGALRQG